MKKNVWLPVLVLVLALSLVGCGEKKDDTLRPDSGGNAADSGEANTGNSDSETGNDNGADADTDTGTDTGTENGSKLGRSRRFYDRGSNDAFANNHGSTFGGAGEELRQEANGMATWRQMLDNGFVRDTDGFLLDGENASWK